MLDQDLRAHPPDLIVDTSPAGIRNSEYYPLEGTPLWERIQHDYRLAATLDGVRFYRHVGPAGP
jgi:hypothetical protein